MRLSGDILKKKNRNSPQDKYDFKFAEFIEMLKNNPRQFCRNLEEQGLGVLCTCPRSSTQFIKTNIHYVVPIQECFAL